jgi:hypothetical protein
MNKSLPLAVCLLLSSTQAKAAELAGVFIEDTIKTDTGQQLVLNGVGLREKLWIDVYVGSLYLVKKSTDVAEILSNPGPWRVQLNFVYKEVAQDKLIEAWNVGFVNNQSAEALQLLQQRIDQFYAFFDSSAVADDRYRFAYDPTSGTHVSKNGTLLGVIPGKDFSNALLEIWLGNEPADTGLKKGLLGLD